MPAVTSVRIGRTPTYLFRKGSTYYFRIAIPVDVRKAFGRCEFNYSLQTDDLHNAMLKANILSTSVRELISKVRRGDNIVTEVDVTEFRKRLFEFAAMWFKALENGKPEGNKPYTKKELDNRITTIETIIDDIRTDVACHDHTRSHDIVEGILKDMGIGEPDKVKGFDEYCRETTILFNRFHAIYLDHAKGIYSKDYPWEDRFTAIAGNSKEEEQQQEQSIPLSEALRLYTEDAGRNWKLKTRDENIAMIQNFIDIVEDCPLNLLTKEKVRSYKTALEHFPRNVTKNPRYRGKTIKEIIGMEVPETDRISDNTIKNRFSKVSSFLLWLTKQGYPVDRYLTDILFLRSPKRPDLERAIFTPEDLGKIFGSKEYLEDRFDRPERFWAPVIALFTGARLEEICQLEVDDIKQVEGIWCIDINASGSKSVKTMAGQRIVPLHPFLVDELKLVDYASRLKKEDQTKLFPDLKRTEKYGYSHEVSKWFGRYHRKVGMEDTDLGKKVFHSFRHTFIDNCKQNGVDRDKLAEVVGHESGHDDMTFGRYGKRYKPEILYEDVISKLDFGIDLSHLKRSKFVVK